MHPILKDIELVSFDLDGTLVDSVPDLAAAVDAVLAECGLPPAGEAGVRNWVGNGSRKLVERALAAADGPPATAERLAQAHERFLHHYGLAPVQRTRLYPGAREALDALRERG